MDKSEKGKSGEDFAAEYLKKLGYEITGRNCHSRFGEIDIIAENGDTVAFVEVKTRKSFGKTSPKESVTKAKQKKIILTAMSFLEESGSDKNIRFDVFEVFLKDEKIYRWNYIENAFDSIDFSGRYDIF